MTTNMQLSLSLLQLKYLAEDSVKWRGQSRLLLIFIEIHHTTQHNADNRNKKNMLLNKYNKMNIL